MPLALAITRILNMPSISGIFLAFETQVDQISFHLWRTLCQSEFLSPPTNCLQTHWHLPIHLKSAALIHPMFCKLLYKLHFLKYSQPVSQPFLQQWSKSASNDMTASFNYVELKARASTVGKLNVCGNLSASSSPPLNSHPLPLKTERGRKDKVHGTPIHR